LGLDILEMDSQSLKVIRLNTILSGTFLEFIEIKTNRAIIHAGFLSDECKEIRCELNGQQS
jgi:hypothetical protein